MIETSFEQTDLMNANKSTTITQYTAEHWGTVNAQLFKLTNLSDYILGNGEPSPRLVCLLRELLL